MLNEFSTFLESIKTEKNFALIESVKNGLYACLESLSTDDANSKPFGSVLKHEEPGKIVNGIENSEYFNQTLSDERLDLVNKAKFGMGRVAAYPAAGRSIASNDPIKNQFTGSQYYAGDGGGETGN